ncbi:predicted protein [Postia placenta Mad-698-R]|nr:predicted protein [Postia placenta Mad-698-R]
MDAKHIPPELWMEIFEQLPLPSDLYNIMRTSKWFCDLAVRATHRHVIWKTPHTVAHNLPLWKVHKGMEGFVHTLELGVTTLPPGISGPVVDIAGRRAQAAVLFPNIASKKLLKMSLDDLHELSKSPQLKPLSFSRNAVCIDLSGSELTDLSFVDLPGIIQNASPEIVQLVEDLVLSHIKGNCLILVTLPMSDDIDNQKAARLARDVDPAGTRTIGVLTKPDTLPPGSVKLRELWLEVLEGRSVSNHLVHGYFCTRQPDDAERAGDLSVEQVTT